MKKIICILTVLAIALSLSMVNFAEDQKNLPGNYNVKHTDSALLMTQANVDRVGSVISTVADATAIGFICPSWNDAIGSLTVTLWKWNTDYDTTVNSDPLFGPDVIENFEDNSFVGFEFDTPLAAGVYYVELSDPSDNAVGVWSGEAQYPGQLVFQTGDYVPKLCLRMQVDYFTPLEEGAVPYGQMPSLEKTEVVLGGDGTDPCEIFYDLKKWDLDYFEDTLTVQFSENEDGTLHVFVPEGAYDAQFNFSFLTLFDFDPVDDSIPCEQYPYMAIRMRVCSTEYDAGSGECFFYTTKVAGATAGYSSSINYDYSTTDWQTVVIDPTAKKLFVDNAKGGDSWMGFRFDPVNDIPTQDVEYDIAWIAFFENEEAALAFDGDFSKYEPVTPEPTEVPEVTPTPEVTAAPEITEAPVATEVPTGSEPEVTAEPTAEPKNNGCGNFVGGGIAICAAAAVALVIARKKER